MAKLWSHINRPSSWAVSIKGYNESFAPEPRTILVLQLGESDYRAAVVSIHKNEVTVRAEHTTPFSSMSFTDKLIEICEGRFAKENGGIILRMETDQSPRVFYRLRRECERMKRELSSAEEASLEIDNLIFGIDYQDTITRQQYEEYCKVVELDYVTDMVRNVIHKSGVPHRHFNDVVFVGGPTHMPMVLPAVLNQLRVAELWGEGAAQYSSRWNLLFQKFHYL